MKIPNDVLAVLSEMTFSGNVASLPPRLLERKLYVAVNKVLEALGGKWNRKLQGHVFDGDPAKSWKGALLTGDYVDAKVVFQFFPTPQPVAGLMLTLADMTGDEMVLEPSAGKGAILDVIQSRFPQCRLVANDINPEFVEVLKGKGYLTVACEDFLSPRFGAGNPDRILMNPPFTRLQDADHITRAFEILKPGGRLVSVCSESPFFHQTTKAERFRALVSEHGWSNKLPENSFKASGTGVNTRLVVLSKN